MSALDDASGCDETDLSDAAGSSEDDNGSTGSAFDGEDHELVDDALSVLRLEMTAATVAFRAGSKLEGAKQALSAVHDFLYAVAESPLDGPILGLVGEIEDMAQHRKPQFLRPAKVDGTSNVSATESLRRVLAVATVELLKAAGDDYEPAYVCAGKIFDERPQRIKKWRERLSKAERLQVEELLDPLKPAGDLLDPQNPGDEPLGPWKEELDRKEAIERGEYWAKQTRGYR